MTEKTSGHHIVILGGGTAGTIAANRLRRALSQGDTVITVVDESDDHLYQPGLLFVPFGLEEPERLQRSRASQLHHGIAYRRSAIDHVDVDTNRVHLTDGGSLAYDVLIIATGAVLVPDATEGLTDKGWNEKVFTFYNFDGAVGLRKAMNDFAGGRLVINVVDMPIKCPVAPLEFAFLADWFFTKRGLRDRVDLTYVTPLDGAFTKPVASRELGTLLAEKHINVVTEFNTGRVDMVGGRLISYDDREVGFDLGVIIPVHEGAAYVSRSAGLGDELNFITCDARTLQSRARDNIFVIGDAAAVPASKAGSVAHFESEVLVENVRRYLRREPLDASYDGHANCFIETGFGKALLIDFNYETEPLTGHFPTAIGLPLLKESRLNHLGKRMFERVYWRVLLPGHSMPGISATMPEAGKHKQLAVSGVKERLT